MSTNPIFLNVRDYGVRGDGSTSDTSKLQALWDSVAAAGGGCLFYPHGRYVITQAGANPWGLVANAQDNLRHFGEGAATVFVHSGDADNNPFDMIRVTGGSKAFEIEACSFDQSELSNPAIDACHVINVEEADITKLLSLTFVGGVATAGSYIKLGGVADKFVSVVWMDRVIAEDAGGAPVLIDSNSTVVWLLDSDITQASGDDAVVISDSLGTSITDVKIDNCRITGTDLYALRVESSGTLERIGVFDTDLFGFVSVDGAQYSQIHDTHVIASAAGSASPVVTLANCLDCQFQQNQVTRESTCDVGYLVKTDTCDAIQVQDNIWIQNKASSPLVHIYDCTNSQYEDNLADVANAGSTTIDAYTIEAVSVDADGLQLVGEQIRAESGTFDRAIRVYPNGALIKNVQINSGSIASCDTGVEFEGSSANYSGLLMVSGGSIDAITAAWDMPSGVFIHIGANASALGPNMFAGRGDPGGVVSAKRGSIYQRIDGGLLSTFYVKESDTPTSNWVVK